MRETADGRGASLCNFQTSEDALAIVTGAGRPRGIGASICRAFADQGCSIFFTCYPSYDRQMYPDDAGTSGRAAACRGVESAALGPDTSKRTLRNPIARNDSEQCRRALRRTIDSRQQCCLFQQEMDSKSSMPAASTPITR